MHLMTTELASCEQYWSCQTTQTRYSAAMTLHTIPGQWWGWSYLATVSHSGTLMAESWDHIWTVQLTWSVTTEADQCPAGQWQPPAVCDPTGDWCYQVSMKSLSPSHVAHQCPGHIGMRCTTFPYILTCSHLPVIIVQMFNEPLWSFITLSSPHIYIHYNFPGYCLPLLQLVHCKHTADLNNCDNKPRVLLYDAWYITWDVEHAMGTVLRPDNGQWSWTWLILILVIIWQWQSFTVAKVVWTTVRVDSSIDLSDFSGALFVKTHIWDTLYLPVTERVTITCGVKYRNSTFITSTVTTLHVWIQFLTILTWYVPVTARPGPCTTGTGH